jgi:hypothetical protein
MERAYDFHELVGCANTLNHLSAIEYGDNGLQFGRVHNKQKNIWAELHPPLTGDTKSNLGDYTNIARDAEIVAALKEGLREAQSLLRSLNMAPSTVARNKTWFLQPWLVETADKHHWAYVPALQTHTRRGRRRRGAPG